MRHEAWKGLAVSVMGLAALAALAILLWGCDLPGWAWPADSDSTPYRTAAGYEFGVEGDLDPGVVGAELDLRIAEWQALRPGYEVVPRSVKYMVIDAASYNGSTGGYDTVAQGIYLCWQTSPPLAATGHELDHVVFGPEYGH